MGITQDIYDLSPISSSRAEYLVHVSLYFHKMILSSKFDKELLAMTLISNIITETVCFRPIHFQVALGVLMRRNKILISELSKYSVCCSYDEVMLFR